MNGLSCANSGASFILTCKLTFTLRTLSSPCRTQLLFSSIDFKWSFKSKLYKIQTLIASNLLNNTLALSRTVKFKVPSGMPRQERDIRGYSIPQYRKKNWQIRNTVSKIDEVPIPHLWSVTLYPSRVFFFLFFFFLSQACIHQHSTSSQPSRENVRRSRIKRYNDRKARSLDVPPISWS